MGHHISLRESYIYSCAQQYSPDCHYYCNYRGFLCSVYDWEKVLHLLRERTRAMTEKEEKNESGMRKMNGLCINKSLVQLIFLSPVFQSVWVIYLDQFVRASFIKNIDLIWHFNSRNFCLPSIRILSCGTLREIITLLLKLTI